MCNAPKETMLQHVLGKTHKLFMIAFLLSFQPRASANVETLIFMYNDLEPYVYQEEGQLTGLIYHYLSAVAAEANVPVRWENIPWEKQIPLLKQGNAHNCSTGLYRNEERSKFLKFSAPIGIDKGHVIVGLRNNQRLIKHDTFLQVTEDKTLSLLVQSNASYGAYIDKVMKTTEHTRSPGSTLRILYGIMSGKYDYTVMTSFMGNQFLRKYDTDKQLAVYDHFTDMASSDAYYLACSMLVSDITMKLLDKVILIKGPVFQ